MQRELLLLREMRDAALAIRALVGDRTAEEVDAEPLRRSALLWHFTVLGEAASQISGYWDIDVETLVATAVDDLPEMIGQLEDAISATQDPEGDLTAASGS
jgi:uncharacterized protein with HEPN domain